MSSKKYVLKKQGSVFIAVGIVVLVIVFTAIFLVYYQVNIIVETVRQDLFYAANNAIVSFDVQDLAYKKYTVDVEGTKEIIEELLNKNYTNNESGITKITIKDLEVVGNDKVDLKLQVKVNFNTVINILGKDEHSLTMKENIKISLLEYGKEMVE